MAASVHQMDLLSNLVSGVSNHLCIASSENVAITHGHLRTWFPATVSSTCCRCPCDGVVIGGVGFVANFLTA